MSVRLERGRGSGRRTRPGHALSSIPRADHPPHRRSPLPLASLARPTFALLVTALLGVVGCMDDAEDASGAGEPTAPAAAAAPLERGKGAQFLLPPAVTFEANPLRLNAPTPALEPGDEVFAVPARMLQGAKEGWSLALRHAQVERVEGGNVVVRMGREPPYAIHPAYVVVPTPGPVRRGSAVLASFRGTLAHAIVTSVQRDRVMVRFIDAGPGYEHALRRDQVFPQSNGLSPGNYAAFGRGQRFEHVLLVSAGRGAGQAGKWLALGYAGAARVVEETSLTPMPLRLTAKPGETVAVAWLGTLVPAKVVSADTVGLLSVRRPRASPTFTVGPGMVMEAHRR